MKCNYVVYKNKSHTIVVEFLGYVKYSELWRLKIVNRIANTINYYFANHQQCLDYLKMYDGLVKVLPVC